MGLKMKRDNFDKYLELRKAKVCDIARELGYTPQYLYMILNHKRSASSPFVAKLLETSGLPFEYFFALDVTQNYQNKGVCNAKYNPTKEEGIRCGQEDEGRKLGRGRTARTTGEALSTQNTNSKVCFQALEERAVGNQQAVSTKQAGNKPAAV